MIYSTKQSINNDKVNFENMSASAAYRGYRLQALYSLSRILSANNGADFVYHLEGVEDLDVENNDGNPIEMIQVKSYGNLTLSDLSPQNSASFFRRALTFIQSSDPPKVKLVNFGSFGEEMWLAWKAPGDHRDKVISKMEVWGFQKEEIQAIISQVELVELEENIVYGSVISHIKSFGTGADPDNAFDLLQYWIYLQSENRARIRFSNLIEKINNVGRFLIERTNYLQEWYTSIQPLEDTPIETEHEIQLRSEYSAGISARYEHILAGLDFQREEKMEAIRQAFSENAVVIIHAASGQGKTTLAYRYLYETYPSTWRFSIKAIENRQHALRIASALAGYAKTLQFPMAIYIDVSPRDSDWTELVRQLAQYSHFQVLVTVREEDFRRATINAEFRYSLVDLAFDEKEARLIYSRINLSGFHLQQLTFEDAWHLFGEGPLMEFVYLLTQTHTLKERLDGQIKRIRTEIQQSRRAASELELLRIVSVASAYDARIHLPALIAILELPDPSLSVEMLEKEYLLRASSDKRYIVGLHPVRSKIISELLSDPVVMPWHEIAEKALPLIPEDEWESFLLQAFVDHPNEFKQILHIAEELVPTTWAGLACIVRGLMWAGVRMYISENNEAIVEARKHFDKGWYLFADLNFAEVEDPSDAVWWEGIKDLFSPEKIETITRMNKLWKPKDYAYDFAKDWLSKQTKYPKNPTDDLDWIALPEILYWAWRWGQAQRIDIWIPDEVMSSAVSLLPLSVLSKISFSLFLLNRDKHSDWLKQHRRTIEERLANEYDILALQEEGDLLTIHFLTFPIEDKPEKLNKGTRLLHEKTVERIQLIRELFPSHTRYGSRGYGHQLPALNIDHDETIKTGIPKDRLPLPWPLRVNRIAMGLADIDVRPATWDSYIESHIQTRSSLISCLEQLTKGISRYFTRQKAINMLELKVFQGEWDRCIYQVNHLPLLPQVAIDKWGLSQPEGGFGRLDNHNQASKTDTLVPKSVLDQIYKPYLDLERKYFSSIQTFMEQCPTIIVINFHAGKVPDSAQQKFAIIDYLKNHNINTNVQNTSIFNLRQARDALNNYQLTFQKLFKDRVGQNSLKSLEERESKVLYRLWYFWYFFVNRPQTLLPRPETQLMDRVNTAQRDLLKKYDDCLARVSSPEIRAIRSSSPDSNWESSSAIWLSLDVDTPLQIYPSIEAIVNHLKQTLGDLDPLDLEYLLLEENYEYTVIIPTVMGRMISSYVWPLRSVFTIADKQPIEEKLWAYIPVQAPASVLLSSGIKQWEHDDIALAHKMSESLSLVATYLSMISEIGRMPDATDASSGKIQGFMRTRSEELSTNLQIFMDTASILLDRFNRLGEQEKSHQPNLVNAVSLLSNVYGQVMPSNNFSGVQTLKIDEIAEYSERLRVVTPVIEEVKLYWIADTIEHIRQLL